MIALPLHKFLYETPFGADRNEIWMNIIEMYNLPVNQTTVSALFSNELYEFLKENDFSKMCIAEFIDFMSDKEPLEWDNNLVKRKFKFLL